jgi:Co/Zn/Cd efflux system component
VHTRAVKDCCEVSADIPQRQRRVLQVVFSINVAMFLAEFVAGWIARSTALLADSVDMFGDAAVYGLSLYVVGRGAVWQARSALLKGSIMAAFGLGVLMEAGLKITQGLLPKADLIGGMGLLALAANTSVLLFLWRRRDDDINMRSVWLCSRNDVMANVGVLLAAAGVAVMDAAWPDILIGLLIAGLFAASAVDVIRSARRELASHSAP